jgi:hypothetical protein
LKYQKGIEPGHIGIVVGDFGFPGIGNERYKIEVFPERGFIVADGSFVFFQSQAIKIRVIGPVVGWNRLQEIVYFFVVGNYDVGFIHDKISIFSMVTGCTKFGF